MVGRVPFSPVCVVTDRSYVRFLLHSVCFSVSLEQDVNLTCVKITMPEKPPAYYLFPFRKRQGEEEEGRTG